MTSTNFDDVYIKLLVDRLKNELREIRISFDYSLDFFLIRCPRCGSTDGLIKKGVRRRRRREETVQLYKCKFCGYKFTPESYLPGTYFPEWVLEEVVKLAVYGLSPGYIAKHIEEDSKWRGSKVTLTPRTVINLLKKCAKVLSEFEILALQRRSDEWQIDDMVQRRRAMFITNVIDSQTRYWISTHVSRERNVNASLKALRLAILRFKFEPRVVKCDGLEQHIIAIRRTCPNAKLISITKKEAFGIINQIESQHSRIRKRVPRSGTFRTIESMQSYLDLLRIYYNFFCQLESLNGKTPAQAVGLDFKPEYGWLTLMKLAGFYTRKYENLIKLIDLSV